MLRKEAVSVIYHDRLGPVARRQISMLLLGREEGNRDVDVGLLLGRGEANAGCAWMELDGGPTIFLHSIHDHALNSSPDDAPRVLQ